MPRKINSDYHVEHKDFVTEGIEEKFDSKLSTKMLTLLKFSLVNVCKFHYVALQCLPCIFTCQITFSAISSCSCSQVVWGMFREEQKKSLQFHGVIKLHQRLCRFTFLNDILFHWFYYGIITSLLVPFILSITII